MDTNQSIDKSRDNSADMMRSSFKKQNISNGEIHSPTLDHKKSRGKTVIYSSNLAKKDSKILHPDLQLEIHPVETTIPSTKNEGWTELKIKEKNIMKRCYHASAFYNTRLYVYGGYEINYGIMSDFYYLEFDESFNITPWTKITPKSQENPGPLYRHTLSVYRDMMFLFGGQKSTTENTNKLWSYDFIQNSWNLITTKDKFDVPCLDSHCANIYYEEKSQKSLLIICTGFEGGKVGQYTNAVLAYSIEEKTWSYLFKRTENTKIAPIPRAGAGSAIIEHYVYIFGGTNGDEKFQDLWRFNLIDLKWELIKCNNLPDPRNGHTMLSYKNNYIIIFGGIQEITHEKDDIICYDIKKNKWIVVENDTFFSLSSPRKTERRHSTRIDSSPSTSPQHPRNKSTRKTKIATDTQTSYISNQQQPHSPGSIKQELKLRALEIEKNTLLEQFEVTDPEQRKLLKVKSPTTQQMLSSILAINDKVKIDDEKLNKKKSLADDLTKQFHYPQLLIESGNKVLGHKPCARDGHSASIFRGHMIIFGGDRHRMCFNDLYMFNLENASKKYEEK